MTKLYYNIFNLIALSLIIYCGVDLFYKTARSRVAHVQHQDVTVSVPSGVERHGKPPFSHFGIITERNLFGSTDKATKIMTKEEKDTADLPPTTLNLKLLGTVAGPEQNARAVIVDAESGKQGLYKAGDSIQEAILKRILRTKVVLEVGDKDEVLTMEETTSSDNSRSRAHLRRPPPTRYRRPGEASGPTITVNRSDIEGALKDINQLLSQARIQPHFKDGSADGLAISRIKRGSIFSKLGLRNGDVIQRIDGKKLDSPEDVFSLYEKLKSSSTSSLNITRRGREQNLNYRFR